MKKFTKPILTLALLAMAGVANAQDWEELAVTVSVHEWRTAAEQFSGEAATEGDAFKCYVRSVDQAIEAGNMTMKNANDGLVASNFADWDSQFFISVPADDKFEEGDKIRVVFDAWSDKGNSNVATQSHNEPGGYMHWACIGSIDFPAGSVNSFDKTFEVGDAPRTGFYTIAFNLATGVEATCYLANVHVYKQKPAPVNPEQPMPDAPAIPEGWQNIVTESPISVHEWRTPDEQFIGPALQGNDGAWYVVARSADEAIEAGNMIMANADNGLVASNRASWDSQFFVDFGENVLLQEGDKFILNMTIKADENSSIGTQAHGAPGNYQHYACVGNVSFKQGWTNWSSGEITVSKEMATGSGGVGLRSVAFNLGNGPHNTFYIAQVQVLIPSSSEPQEPEQFIIPERPADYIVLEKGAFQKWDGVGADAIPTNELINPDWFIDEQGLVTTTGMVAGTSTVDPYIFADLSAFESLMIICGKVDKGNAAAVRAEAVSPEGLSFRVLINRSDERNEEGTDWVKPIELTATSDGQGWAEADITKDAAGAELDYAHLNAIKLNWSQPETRVFALMAKEKPATGIKDINVNEANKGIFDLNGRRVNGVSKGIFIINGQKVVF